ncbi:hypothetical protein EVAR_73040_1 [Eumeta japonica]|uniref:Uncharacterized protein n=1 Tax=Eumeta variegata TaxID=151549 RepID=A0A4C1T413_EUMVA|nr:hypothetical protein EVAR_73040_1 [Eumeta japonica]
MWRSGLEQFYNNSYIATMYGYLHLSTYRKPGNAGIDMTDSSIIHPGKLVATRYLPGVERPNDPWGVAASRQVGLYAETGSVRVQGRANENAEWRTGELWYNNHSDVSELVVDRCVRPSLADR